MRWKKTHHGLSVSIELQASQLLKWRWLKFPLDLGWKPARKIRSCAKQLQQVVSERWVSLAIAKLTRLYIILYYILLLLDVLAHHASGLFFLIR